MANAFASLFGPGGKAIADIFGKGGTTDPYGTLNPEQKTLTQALGPELTNQINSPAPAYTGQYVAPYSGGEQQAADQYNRLAAISGQSLGQLANYNPQTVNQNFDQQVAQPSLDFWKRNIAPTLDEDLSGFGTQKEYANSRSLNDLQNNLSTQRFSAQQAYANNALAASGAINNQGVTGQAINSVPREIQQAGLDKAYADYVYGNNYKQNSINQMLGFLGIGTQTYQQNPNSQLLAAGLGAAATIGGAMVGGPAGAAAGSTIGSSLTNYSGSPTTNPNYYSMQGSQGPEGSAFQQLSY